MGFFKTLFGGKEETEEQKQQTKEQYNFEVLTYDGMQALRVGKTDYAIACLTRALTIKEDEETRQHLATAYLQADRIEEAAQEYAVLCEQHGDQPTYHIARAELLFQLEHYEALQQSCRQALEANPSLAMPHLLLAKSAMATGDAQQAVDEASKAIVAKDDYAEAYFVRASAYMQLQQYEAANADLDRLINADVATDDVLMLKASLCVLTGDKEQAIDCYRQVIDSNPFVPDAYMALASLYDSCGKPDEAGQVIAEAAEQLGMSPEEAKKQLVGDARSLEEYMQNAYNALNPYQFSVNL